MTAELKREAEAARAAGHRGQLQVPVSLTQPHQSLVAAAGLVGGMERAMECAVSHASSRHQFGAALRSFQGVQALLARIAEEFLLSEAALAHALRCLDSSALPAAAAAAKAQASASAGVVAASAHQVLGATGFTAEHELAALTAMLGRARDLYGDEYAHAQTLRIAVAGSDSLWSAAVDGLGWAFDEAVESAP